jgi:hypothetical protein
VCVWRWPGLSKLATLTGHSMRVLYLAVSPDGQTIVTGAGAPASCIQWSTAVQSACIAGRVMYGCTLPVAEAAWFACHCEMLNQGTSRHRCPGCFCPTSVPRLRGEFEVMLGTLCRRRDAALLERFSRRQGRRLRGRISGLKHDARPHTIVRPDRRCTMGRGHVYAA